MIEIRYICDIDFTCNRNIELVMNMNFEQLNFTVYCIGSVADALKMNARKVYQLLKESGILKDYIVPGYNVLHTFSREYLVEDVVSLMREKGLVL